MACLLLPLSVLAAPAQKPGAPAPAAEKPAHHWPIVVSMEQTPATGTFTMPPVGAAVKKLGQDLAARPVPRERSLMHVNLRHSVRLVLVTAPHWTTTTPHAPATLSLPLISLHW